MKCTVLFLLFIISYGSSKCLNKNYLNEISFKLVPKDIPIDIDIIDGSFIPEPENETTTAPENPAGLGRHKNKCSNSLMPLVTIGNGQYYFGTYFKANYFRATQFCNNHGMELLSIETYEENVKLISYLKESYPNIDHFWTSGTDLVKEGEFVWMSTGKAFAYKAWAHPQPDNAGGNENCLEIWKLGDNNYIWNDIVCQNDYNFICEYRQKGCSSYV